MKKVIFTIFCCIYTSFAKAQLFGELNLNRVCDTIEYNGEFYVRQNYEELFTVLGNTKDKYFDTKQLMRDGSTPPSGFITRQRRPIEMTKEEAISLEKIVDNSFSSSQIESIVDEHEIIIRINISSETGYPTGVSFTYYNNSGYETIPMDVWQNIETHIMSEFCFTISDIGKELSYCSISWSQCPKGKEGGLTMPENGKVTLPDGKLENPIGGTIGGSLVTP